ncbi:WD40 repeat-like protein [Auricularia subglabra TFB-10046 SS5]|nr:WD40 repeat-like protein [Auricularia subglabra TFB-10046 SS5]
MARLAFNTLLVNGATLTGIARAHIGVYDKATGSQLRTCTIDAPVRAAALDPSGQHVVVVDDNKRLIVLDFATLARLSERVVAKKCSIVLVTPDGGTILLADKFGDVYSYPLHPPTAEPAEPDDSEDKPKEKEPTPGTLILGHVSILTSLVLALDGKYILTADRDEHIRVSHYPRGFLIHAYCLGSTKFVSALHLPPARPELLVSGGGEDVLRVWRWMDGALQRTVAIGDAVRPRIAVEAPVLKHRQHAAKKARLEDDKELVVHKIESVGATVVFAALGASALFYFGLNDSAPEVRAHELGAPLLDYVRNGSMFWVSLDSADKPIAVAIWEAASASLVAADAPALDKVPEGERDAELYMPLALLPKSAEDEAEDAGHEPASEKERGRRKVKNQLKALRGESVASG